MGTITNDKGRLSGDDIQKMVKDAEEFKAEDEANRAKVEARNGLEHACYGFKNEVESEELASKVSADDKALTEKVTAEVIEWLETNPSATVGEIEEKRQELESKLSPVIVKLRSSPSPD